MNELVLKNANILKNNEFVLTNIGIKGGAVSEISSKEITGKTVVECAKKFLMPGIIDCHVHFRTPGFEFKEDWKTGSRACVSSGVTTVLDMPNNSPPTTTVNALKDKREIVQKSSLVNFGFHFGTTDENTEEILGAQGIGSVKVFTGKSTGDLFVKKEGNLKKIFEAAKKKDFVVCVHAEDQKIIEKNEKKFRNTNYPGIHAKIRTTGAESTAIQTILELQKKIKNKLHVCHLSSKDGVALLREAKEEQPYLTCEVTPHHLFFTERDLEKHGNFLKVNPSIKSESDRNALWKGITDGTIDCVSTDHAPHLVEEKKKNYWEAPSGVPGVETLAPLMLNAVSEKKLSLEKVVSLLCEKPAEIFGIKNKSQIKKGFDADLVLFDLQKTHTIQNSKLFTKCRWSPFDSIKLKGVLEKTIIRGELVFDEGKFLEGFLGKEVF